MTSSLSHDYTESTNVPDPSTDTTNGTKGSEPLLWAPAYWSSFIEHPQAQQSTEFGKYLRLVGLPFILFAGFLGNALTIALMMRPSMRKHSYSPYLLALAASDSVALVVRLVFWINLLSLTFDGPVLVYFASQAACALVEYLCTANHVLCSWLVVCMTFERVLVIALPLKSTRIVSTSMSVKVVSAFLVFCLLLISYVLAVVRWKPGAGGCVLPFPRELYAHFVVATTFVSISPLALICCGNFIIVVVLYRQTRQRAKLMSSRHSRSKGMSRERAAQLSVIGTNVEKEDSATTMNNDRTHDDNPSLSCSNGVQQAVSPKTQLQNTGDSSYATLKQLATNKPPNSSTSGGSGSDQHVRRVTMTLLIVSLSFLILVMPNALLVLALGLRPEWTSLLPALDPLALLWDCNFAINFYLYVLAGASFRTEVTKMLKCQ